MNEQLDPMVPVDPIIREQLTRRSGGLLPDGLDLDVFTALDARTPSRTGFTRPRLHLTAPRLAGAALGIAFVAVLVGALGAPALRGPAGPAGYPSGRALTTDELVNLLAGPAPALNTTLIVATTIDLRNDVCPMNRYPTAGVIHGVSPQICVMEGTPAPQLTGSSVTGTFAVRYLGGRSFGLLGQVTPAASGLAYHVTDEWPADGKPFVVEGYLGAYPQNHQTCLSISLASPGDVLNPSGDDPCWQNWLSADGSPAPMVYPASDTGGSSSGSGGGAVTDGSMPADPSPAGPPTVVPRLTAPASADAAASSFDPLALYGKARFVEAGGIRQIDSVTHDTLYGTWVVRGVTAGCPGAPAYDSRGCIVWRVLAKVNDVLGGTPSPSIATPVTTPAGYTPVPPATPQLPSPQTTGPLAPALTGLVGPGGRPLTADELTALWVANPSGFAGRVAIVQGPIPYHCSGSGACLGTTEQLPAGIWAVKLYANGVLTPLGSLADTNATPLPLSAAVSAMASPSNGLLLVDAWLDWTPSLACDTPPYPSDSLCGLGAVTSILTSERVATQSIGNPFVGPQPSGVVWLMVGQGDYQVFGSSDLNARPIHGLFLLKGATIIARVEPTAPGAGSSGITGSAPTGLIGPNNTALTASQLEAVILADPYRLNGRYVIDVRSICDGGADCSGRPPNAVADLIQPNGSPGLVGPLDLAPDGGVIWTVPQALGQSWDKRYIFILDASIFAGDGNAYLDSDASAELTAQPGDFEKFAPPGTPTHGVGRGLFLVTRVDTGKTCGGTPTMAGADCSPQVTILARLEPATLP